MEFWNRIRMEWRASARWEGEAWRERRAERGVRHWRIGGKEFKKIREEE